MSLNKSKGDMYEAVSHTWNPLAGECPSQCSYCYVKALPKPVREGKYAGEPRLQLNQLKEPLGRDRTIFVCNCTDLFAEGVPDGHIRTILDKCKTAQDNTYLFQTKNPYRYAQWLDHFPNSTILGTTIESNRHYPDITKAPSPQNRALAMSVLPDRFSRFVTIEPIMAFDLDLFINLIQSSRVDWVNIGADSCGHNLPEPTRYDVIDLIDAIKANGVEVRRKTNLSRLLA